MNAPFGIGMRLFRLRRRVKGFALPATLFMIIVIAGASGVMTEVSTGSLRQIKGQQFISSTYFSAEGALHVLLANMSVQSSLWDQQSPLATKPSGYTQYSPASYTANNGVPTCTSGVACHRNYYPAGGGLLKNFGPLAGDGGTADASRTIVNQLNTSDLPDADATLGGISAWVQVERLDETTPSASTVGGNLSSSVAEGGNAKNVRYRLTGTSLRRLSGRIGTATLVMVAEMSIR